MKILFGLLPGLLLCFNAALRAQPAPDDPVGEHLFPPDFILQQKRVIALTDEQRQSIEDIAQKGQARVQEAEKRLGGETQKLAVLVAQPRVDESAALAQSDKIASVDQELRRAQLHLLISIKNKLTPEQQSKLKNLKSRLMDLQAKGERIQAGFQRWQEQGRDPSALAQIMQEVEPLIRDGKLVEAETLLDRALQLLAEPKVK